MSYQATEGHKVSFLRGLYLEVLRAHFWLSAQVSLLEKLREPHVGLGSQSPVRHIVRKVS